MRDAERSRACACSYARHRDILLVNDDLLVIIVGVLFKLNPALSDQGLRRIGRVPSIPSTDDRWFHNQAVHGLWLRSQQFPMMATSLVNR